MSQLDTLFNTQTVWVYSDGGASTHGAKTGAYAAIIIFPDGTKKMVGGSCNYTTVNRMELQAINAALYYIRAIHFKGIVHGVDIQIITDSEITLKGITADLPTTEDLYRYSPELFDLAKSDFKILARAVNLMPKTKSRHTNLDAWLAFDELARPFASLTIQHMSRNLEAAQAVADAFCHVARVEFEKLFNAWEQHPDFETLSHTRKFKSHEYRPPGQPSHPDPSSEAGASATVD